MIDWANTTILVLFGVVVFLMVRLNRIQGRMAALRMELHDEKKYGERMYLENRSLRDYADNRHVVYSDFYKEKLLQEPTDRGLVILIRAGDFYTLVNDQWHDGFDVASDSSDQLARMMVKEQAEAAEEHEHVEQLRASFTDSRFDRDFADLVNELRHIAIKYANTQQLRERIAHCIISFRTHLGNRQRGKSSVFRLNRD